MDYVVFTARRVEGHHKSYEDAVTLADIVGFESGEDVFVANEVGETVYVYDEVEARA